MKKIIIILLLIFSFYCKKSTDTTEQDAQLLTYILQTNSNNPSISACAEYISIENLCISQPDSTLIFCSESNVEKLKLNILPDEAKTEEVLNAFFSCWQSCLVIFNTQDSTCSSGKYANTRIYRDTLRNGRTQASISWGTCFQQCNNGNTENEILQRTGARYSGQLF